MPLRSSSPVSLHRCLAAAVAGLWLVPAAGQPPAPAPAYGAGGYGRAGDGRFDDPSGGDYGRGDGGAGRASSPAYDNRGGFPQPGYGNAFPPNSYAPGYQPAPGYPSGYQAAPIYPAPGYPPAPAYPSGPGYPPPGYRPTPDGYGPPDYGPDERGPRDSRPDDPAFGPAPPRPSAEDRNPYGSAPDDGLGYDGPRGGSPRYGDPTPRPTAPFTPDIPEHRPRAMRDYSWTYIAPPTPREIKLHDIVTILVDEKSELLVQSRYNRQRNATFKAQLKEFLRISEDLNLTTAAPEAPTIDATLQGRLQSDGTVADREGIRYRIAATVVGVLPNGNVVLEARKAIRSTDGLWEYTLTGTIASRDVKSDYTAVSETIANLQIEKRQSGKTADATQRPWGMRLYDKLSPF